nr:hypothetical protein [Arthrobacter globiformis]
MGLGAGGEPLGELPEAPHVLLIGALGREPGCRAGRGGRQINEVPQVVALVPAQLLGDLRLPDRQHSRHITSTAAPAAGAKEPLAPQHREGLAEGKWRDAQMLGNDRFRRKPLARVEQPHEGALPGVRDDQLVILEAVSVRP